jgi:hypothetical protein
MLGVGREDNNPPEKSVTKTPEPIWRRSRQTQGCSARKEEESVASNIRVPFLSVYAETVDISCSLLRNKKD